MDLEFSTPKEWPSHAKEFMALEQLLRCNICFKFFTNCMMTQCAHNFCSLCIRQYLNLKSNCPICFQEAFEPALRKNRIVDEILRTFCATRSKLIELFRDTTVSHKKDETCTSLKNKPLPVLNFDDPEFFKSHAKEKESLANVAYVHELMSLNKKKSCDEVCLSQTVRENKRAYLRKCVYHIMKDRQIKECLKKFGLNTKGKRKELIERHKQFVCLYNAECDAVNPKPVEEIIKEVEVEEKLKKTPQKLFCTNRNSDLEDIEKERLQYVTDNKSHFDILVTEANKTRLRKSDSNHSKAVEQHDPSSSIASLSDVAIVISSSSGSEAEREAVEVGISRSDFESDSTVEFGDSPPSDYHYVSVQSSAISNDNEIHCDNGSNSNSSCSTIELNLPALQCSSNFELHVETAGTSGLSDDDNERPSTTCKTKRLSLRKRDLSDKACCESTEAKLPRKLFS